MQTRMQRNVEMMASISSLIPACNPRHLDSVELSVEMEARGLNPRSKLAKETLARYMHEEDEGIRTRPGQVRHRDVEFEKQQCEAQLTFLVGEVQQATAGSPPSRELCSILQSRAAHLARRVERFRMSVNKPELLETLWQSVGNLLRTVNGVKGYVSAEVQGGRDVEEIGAKSDGAVGGSTPTQHWQVQSEADTLLDDAAHVLGMQDGENQLKVAVPSQADSGSDEILQQEQVLADALLIQQQCASGQVAVTGVIPWDIRRGLEIADRGERRQSNHCIEDERHRSKDRVQIPGDRDMRERNNSPLRVIDRERGRNRRERSESHERRYNRRPEVPQIRGRDVRRREDSYERGNYNRRRSGSISSDRKLQRRRREDSFEGIRRRRRSSSGSSSRKSGMQRRGRNPSFDRGPTDRRDRSYSDERRYGRRRERDDSIERGKYRYPQGRNEFRERPRRDRDDSVERRREYRLEYRNRDQRRDRSDSRVEDRGRYDGRIRMTRRDDSFDRDQEYVRNRGPDRRRDGGAPRNPERGWDRKPTCKMMSDWHVRFSGDRHDPPVEDIVFRLEHLARSHRIYRDDLVDGLHNVLTGEAGGWFWHFLRKHPQPRWEDVREALTQKFASKSTDAEVRSIMAARTQRSGEKFDDYSREVERMSFQLREPMRESRLLELLKKNADPDLRQVLCLHDIRSVEHMQDLCQRYEMLWSSRGRMEKSQKKVDELDDLAERFGRVMARNIEPQSREQAEAAALEQENFDEAVRRSVEAIQPKKLSAVKCWNCDKRGHTHRDCDAPKRVMCFACGLKDAYKSTCPRCQGNGLRSGATGPFRSGNPFGPITTQEQPPDPQTNN